MRTTTLNRYKVSTTIVRGFFHCFVAGLIDSHMPGAKDITPQTYKKLVADNYEQLSAHFLSVCLPTLMRLNYTDIEALEADMKKRKFTNETSPKILLRYACGSKALYEAVVAEYQTQVEHLLNGKPQTVSDFQKHYHSAPDPLEAVDISLAIRQVVRTQMMAYASGINNGKPQSATLHQATVYKQMIYGMIALLHEEIPNTEGDNLEMVFRRVCLNSDNFETLMNEMNQAYQDLA